MSGGGRRSVGPPMSKFCSDLQIHGERMSGSDKHVYEPLCLCTPVPIRRDSEVTKCIPLSAEPLFGLQAKSKFSTAELVGGIAKLTMNETEDEENVLAFEIRCVRN